LTSALKKGTIVLRMGAQMMDVLLPKVRRNILALLFGRSGEAFYLREIVRATAGGKGAVERELKSLSRAGILLREKRGNLTYYRANADCPIYPELQGLVLKTVGLADVLRDALAGIDGVKLAFVYGSMAQGTADAKSDVDVVIVADDNLAAISTALVPAQKRLGREINPTIYSSMEFHEKLKAKHQFLTRVLQGPKIVLLGGVDELTRVD
jgi:predicted nucleotidyltransferase